MDAREQHPVSDTPSQDQRMLSGALPPSKERPITAWVLAGVIVLGVVLALVFSGRRHGTANPNRILPDDPYATKLQVTDLAMSESTSLSGGKSTFLDGQIRNTGTETVSGVTVQVLFANDEGMPPRVETVPLMLIRTREPYVDTEPVSAAPLHPGDSREFRLIFESLPENWNTQLPQLHVTGVETK